MKRLLVFLPICFVFSLLVLSVEDETSLEGTEPQLTLTKPQDQTLEPGEANDVCLEIGRKNIQKPVTVEIDQLPEGVRVTDAKVKIDRDNESVTVTLRADAASNSVSNHSVVVTAKAPPDLQVTEVFKVSVTQ
jgi:hypothetical protein